MEKNELKSYDDLNQPETHSTEVLLSTIEELKRTKKQLEIAVEALEAMSLYNPWRDDPNYRHLHIGDAIAFKMHLDLAEQALNKIKELEK